MAATVATLCLGTGATSAQAAAADTEEAMFSFGCMMPVEVCVAAGQQASDAAGAEAYLSRYEAIPVPDGTAQINEGTAKPGGFGFIQNPGAEGRRFFGWRFSRGGFGRILAFQRCARLVTGELVNCRFVGRIGFQANFTLRNRFVENLESRVMNLIPEQFNVSNNYACGGPSATCRSASLGPSLLSANGVAEFRFLPFQLNSSGGHEIILQWSVFDPVTGTTAWTPRYDSVNFGCQVFPPPSTAGECFFSPGTRGDSM